MEVTLSHHGDTASSLSPDGHGRVPFLFHIIFPFCFTPHPLSPSLSPYLILVSSSFLSCPPGSPLLSHSLSLSPLLSISLLSLCFQGLETSFETHYSILASLSPPHTQAYLQLPNTPSHWQREGERETRADSDLTNQRSSFSTKAETMCHV